MVETGESEPQRASGGTRSAQSTPTWVAHVISTLATHCAFEGAAEGLGLGASEGELVGLEVGLAEGELVGLEDGAAVGVLDGLAVGAILGDAVGVTEGVLVGLGDGTTVGVLDGVGVGAALGDTVGVADGDADGVTVGETVGRRSGLNSKESESLQPIPDVSSETTETPDSKVGSPHRNIVVVSFEQKISPDSKLGVAPFSKSVVVPSKSRSNSFTVWVTVPSLTTQAIRRTFV